MAMGVGFLLQAAEFEHIVEWVSKLTGTGIFAAFFILWLAGRIVSKRELDRAIADGERWRLMAERTQDDNEQLVSQNERLEGLLDKALQASPKPREARHDGRRLP